MPQECNEERENSIDIVIVKVTGILPTTTTTTTITTTTTQTTPVVQTIDPAVAAPLSLVVGTWVALILVVILISEILIRKGKW